MKTDIPDIEHYADKLSAINEISAHFDGIHDAMKRLPVPGRKIVAGYMQKHLAHLVADPDAVRADAAGGAGRGGVMITDQLRHRVLREASRVRQSSAGRRLLAGLLILVCEDHRGDLVWLGYCGSAGDMPGDNPRAVWPGVFAVSEWGRVFVATGGSFETGAERWEVAA